MTENLTKLRQWVGQHTDSPNGHTLLELVLAEHRTDVERLRAERDEWETNARSERAHRERQVAELSSKAASARDAVLEDVATLADDSPEDVAPGQLAVRIRALKARPAEPTLPKSKVRDVLTDLGHGTGNEGHEQYDAACRDFSAEAMRRLGIDAPPTLSERVATSQAKTEGASVKAPPYSEGLCDRCGEPANEHDAAGVVIGLTCASFVAPRSDS